MVDKHLLAFVIDTSIISRQQQASLALSATLSTVFAMGTIKQELDNFVGTVLSATDFGWMGPYMWLCNAIGNAQVVTLTQKRFNNVESVGSEDNIRVEINLFQYVFESRTDRYHDLGL